jgi:replication-associated recombination protein RarA
MIVHLKVRNYNEENIMISVDANPMQFQWERKFAPQTLAECILPQADREMFEGIIKEGRIPSMTLVSRSPGTGKTTIANVLVNEVKAMMYFVNGADCKIDFIRNELTRFASSMVNPEEYPGGKVIVIDEFDRKALADAQRHMRSFMEAFSHNCTVIITANNADGIIEPLFSRAPIVEFGKATATDKINMLKQMIVRCREILEHEGIPCEDQRVLAALVKTNFPDFRKTTKQLDRYSKRGQIDAGILTDYDQASDIEQLIGALKTKDFKTIRGLTNRYVHDYPTFITKLYTTLYDHAQPASIPSVIMTIGENQKYYQQVANLEIHLNYLLIQLMMETNWK